MWQALARVLRVIPGLRGAVRLAIRQWSRFHDHWQPRRERLTVDWRQLKADWRLMRQDASGAGATLRFGVRAGWLLRNMIDAGRVSFQDASGRAWIHATRFMPDPRTAVILAAGQSNLANECAPDGLHRPGEGVYNFNFLDGWCYAARDPLLGATGRHANLLTRLGDQLVRTGAYDRVLLVPVTHGGTFATDWAPGGSMNLRLMLTLELLRGTAVVPTHVLWQQGEAEGASGGDPVAWAGAFNAMVDGLRRNGVSAPVYVAQCTVCCCGPNEAIRAAQRGVVDAARGVVAGPDIDSVGIEDRFDGCHLSAGGLDKAAALWLAALQR